MRIKIVKWLAITALLVTVLFWNFATRYQLPLNLLISSAAAVVFVQAIRAKKYRWAAGFLTIALLYNPAVLVFRLTDSMGFVLVVLSLAAFAVSLSVLKPQPLLSIPSITDRTPGSQSL